MGQPVAELDKAIFHVYQAKSGDYWFGSWNEGLYRYDGEGLTHFSTIDGLRSHWITEIKEDVAGDLYIGTLAGVDKFDGQSFKHLEVTPDNDPHDWKLEPGDLWFKGLQGRQGAYRFDGKQLHYLEFPVHSLDDGQWKALGRSWGPYDVYQIYQDREGNVWFGTGAFGLCRFDGKQCSWLYERHLTAVEGAGDDGIRALIEDARGRFWISHTRYLYDIHPEVKAGAVSALVSYDRLPGPGGLGVLPQHLDHADGGDCLWFMSIVEDEQQKLWMACYGAGVYKFDGEKLVHYPVLFNGQPITTFSIYRDNAGGLWVGTHEHGAYRFNGQSFEQFSS